LARVYEKTGARDRAQHMYALAAQAGGPAAQNSREQAIKLNPATADKALALADGELQKMRSVVLSKLNTQTSAARFILMFDNSSSADRVQFLDGDEVLRNQTDALQKADFSIKFPEVSSIKLILIGAVSCGSSECRFEIQPLNSMQQGGVPQLAGTGNP